MRQLFALTFALMLVACGPSQVTNTADPAPGPFDLSYTAYEALLRDHVHEGLVDYAALVGDRAELNAHLANVAAVSQEAFDQWGQADQLAFLINAYNAYTLQLIVEHWPVDSIKDTHALNNPWDHFRFSLFGEERTLNEIEHDLIRAEYDESRIHFALVCAAKSCPPLINRAYRGDDLEETLEEVTRNFLQNPSANDLADPGAIRVSQLFNWYAQDFIDAAGSVQAFIAEHSGRPITADAMVDFVPYDWTINAR